MILKANFISSLKKDEFINKTNQEIENALFRVGAKIVEDAILKQPRPPILTGDLRSSYSIEINGNILQGKANEFTELARKQNLLRVSFNTIYAARWHEKPFRPGPVSQRDGQVGNKYLSSKIERYKNNYLELFKSLLDI